jgi:uncharacterized membrane protein
MRQTRGMTLAPEVPSAPGPESSAQRVVVRPPTPGEGPEGGSYVAGDLVGGPRGRHSSRYRRWGTLSFLVLVTIIACVLGYAQKAPCRTVSNWTHNYQYTRVCYSDILPLYSTEKLAQGKTPYVDTPVEYPVIIGAAMEAAAQVAKAAPADKFDQRNALFYDATAILLTIAAVIAVVCTALTAGRRRLDAVLLAGAPLLAFHAFTNWDLLAVAFAAGGLLAWSKRAPAIAGLLIGFGGATKAYPMLLLIALGLLAYRAGQIRAWAKCTAWAVGALAATYAVVWPFAGSYADSSGKSHNNLWRFVELNQTRPADWDSVPFVIQYLGSNFTALRMVEWTVLPALVILAALVAWRRSLRAAAIGAGSLAAVCLLLNLGVAYARARHGAIPYEVLNTWGEVGAVILFVVVGFFVLTAPRRPRVPQVAFLVIAAFLLANKVDSPQYSLWLLPLAALAYPRWKPLMVWQVIEILEVVLRYLWFTFDDSAAYGKAGVAEGWFVAGAVLRQLALLGICALIVRSLYRPEFDPVRAAGVDDPAGGVFDGAPDKRAFA